MNRDGAAPPSPWLEVDIAQSGDEVQAVTRGDRNVHTRPQTLTKKDALEQFSEWVRVAAARSHPLDPPVRAEDLHAALFQGEFLEVLSALRGAAGGPPLLMRLMPQHRDLEGIPWEALCQRGKELEFLGTSQELSLVRGVHTTKPSGPRRVDGAVRMLVISPLDEDAPDLMRAELQEAIDSGHLEWLEPLTGARARLGFVEKRLMKAPVPHILHFIGHGTATPSPALQLAEDVDGHESWLKVALLGNLLRPAFAEDLRLVTLESCAGAQPGALTSAAARLGDLGADAVLAHLWPVRAPVARHCSTAFYRALIEETAHCGDVARSLQAARFSVFTHFKESAEAFSPVLYLRNRDSSLFDFRQRRTTPPQASPPVSSVAAPEPPELRGLGDLMKRPFSLVLGDRWNESLAGFRQTLHDKLTGPWAAPAGLPMSALAQRFALKSGPKALSPLFQHEFRGAMPSIPLVESFAAHLPPGVHLTLLRTPMLEEALVRLRPEQTLYVVQPLAPGGGAPVLRRWDGEEWQPLDELPQKFDPERETTLVRLYRGYLSGPVFETPLLTEDDYLTEVRDLESVLTPELADVLLGSLRNRPTLLLGMSLLTWHHRMLLNQLFDTKPLSDKSRVLLEPDEPEAESWQRGRGLPRNGPVQVVQAASERLRAFFDALPPGVSP
ncbi:CHAT domain-containing protein [Myxococcus sp. K15C18031901]|uniref:CHAT domain-containing protein n=1 Tax=Myxococcus dinghuensis TaxID=2906761 RepID=UPI0020A7C149|nr:CHAT domain-containing protein [Myxococcus dinghuensis]MCP3097381.1 CHAT domain-containing protein [Myxococcus dinghuensis]